jgi:hypothetical protein
MLPVRNKRLIGRQSWPQRLRERWILQRMAAIRNALAISMRDTFTQSVLAVREIYRVSIEFR